MMEASESPRALTSRDQLLEAFSSGCKPREDWRIGTEHEKIGFCLETYKPIPYEGKCSIRRTLELLASEDWNLEYEAGNPIALKRGMASITLEPGGQLELSGEPLASVHDTCQEVRDHLRLLRSLQDELHIGFLGLGFQPKWKREDIPWMPKGRYDVMHRYMPQVGAHGLDMMLRTATVQVNLDFESEADMARKMRIGYCLQPIVTALFAASPFVAGKPSGYLSYRAHCWRDTDPARTGIPAMIFDENFGFAHYMEWLLDAPMYFIIRDSHYIDCAGQNFRDFLQGKLTVLPGQFPTMDDWELHATTVYPEVRMKQFLEMRGADAGGKPWICALPALWKGLLYDERSIQQAWEMVADWTHEEVVAMHNNAPKTALKTPFRDTTLLQLAETMLDIAQSGLEQINCLSPSGKNETIHLAPLMDAVSRGQTQAEQWLDAYAHIWNGNIDRAFSEAALP
ncbi:MAG: glutamate--cysteine ligase [Mariprofundaceae bacterium]|nr:glutamate--cysteine ligase [Mariprofundaceae bacterium]